jgi:hypothetical protein
VTKDSEAPSIPRTLFLTVLFVSIAGFLGYYDGTTFITPPTVSILGTQLVLIFVAGILLRIRIFRSAADLAPLLIVALWAALTLLWTDDVLISARRWLLVFIPGIGLALLAAADPRPAQSFMRFKWLLVVITFASYIFSLNVYAFGDITGTSEFDRFRILDLGGWIVGVSEGGRQYLNLNLYIHRFSGFTSNPNSFALFAALALISLCATAKLSFRSGGWIEITLILMTAIILVLSASRAAVAMSLVGLVVIFLLRTERRKLARLCVPAILALTFLLYALPVLQTGPGLEGGEEIFDLRQRADVWRLAIQAAADVWFNGLGFGMTQEAVFAPLGIQTSGHSMPLSLLLETGVIGLLLVLIVWFRPIFTLTNSGESLSGHSIAVIALLLALFVHQTIDSSVFRYHWAHFVFAYLIGASSRLAVRSHNA